ncbi:MAG: 50S ribosomal protein L18e [Thermoplasmatales archaeon]|nr:50S ribosomal protein L18e [Thermoplasmatales archaeon]
MKSNAELVRLIDDLKKTSYEHKAKIWKTVAVKLEKSLRNRPGVNLSRIERNAKNNETVIIPGKVLGSGDINKQVAVAAFSFSDNAKKKILGAKGKVFTIRELMEKNPEGSNIRIMG